MSRAMMILVLLVSFGSVAHGYERIRTLCGRLDSVTVSPHCNPGEMCPHSIRLEQILTDRRGHKTVLETRSHGLLNKLLAYNHQNVCVKGEATSRQTFEVYAISRARSIPRAN